MSYVSHMSLSISGVKILTIIINIYIYYNSVYKSPSRFKNLNDTYDMYDTYDTFRSFTTFNTRGARSFKNNL